MRKILFPTDFSDISKKAFHYALEFARKKNAMITTIHSYTIPPIPTSYPIGTSEEIANAFTTSELESYKEFSKELHKMAEEGGYGDIEINHIMEQGFAVDEIVNLSKAENYYMVVMGTGEVEGLARALFGTHTGRIVGKIECPLLIIPQKAEVKEIKKIAYAIDFEEVEKEEMTDNIMDWMDLLGDFGAEGRLVYVSSLDEVWSKQKLERFRDVDWLSNRAQKITLDIVENPDVLAGLRQYVWNNGVNLLLMKRHQKTFFNKLLTKSYTKAMSYQTPIPLLIF